MNFDGLMVRDRVDRIVEWGRHLDELAALSYAEFSKARNLAAAESFLRIYVPFTFDGGR